MTHRLRFDALQAILHHSIAPLPDDRNPSPHTRDTIPDAALGALGSFLTQSPSFLESQRRLQHPPGRTNAETLFGVEQIPCDNQVRTLLDPIALSSLAPVFEEIVKGLEQHRLFEPFRVRGDHLLVALDGTPDFSSKTIHGPTCLPRQRTNRPPFAYHPALTPVIVCPGRPDVSAWPPEYIMPPAGAGKQACEQQAGKRWLSKHAQAGAPPQRTVLGDDRDSKQPFCALAQPQDLHFIVTCKPASHPKFSARLACWQATDGMPEHAGRCGNGRFTAVTMYRDSHDVLLRGGDDAWSVTWFESTGGKATTGEQWYPNSLSTKHRLSAENLAAVAQVGRGRWKIENEHNNVLKTRGDHLGHNFGHGQQSLAAFLLSRNLLAFLFHTVLEWSDEQYALLRRGLARRQTFCEDIRALTRSRVFESWDQLMDCLLRGLDLQPQVDPG
jgi:hypothetical protein